MKSIKQIITIRKSTTVNYIVLDGKVGLKGLLYYKPFNTYFDKDSTWKMDRCHETYLLDS